MVLRPIPFSEPPQGWYRWSSNAPDARLLDELISSGKTIGLSALDVQLKYPQLQTYNPSNFSKNFSRRKQDLSFRSGVDSTPPVVAAAVVSGSIPLASPTVAPSAANFGPVFPIGVQEMMLPGFIDKWYDGRFNRVLAQYHLLWSAPVAWLVEDEGTTLVARYVMSRNFTEPRHAFGKFQLGNGDSRYPSQHVQTISRCLNCNAFADDKGKIVYEMRVPLPFPVDCRFTDKEGRPGMKNIKYTRTGEVHVHLELIERGHDCVTVNDFDLRSTRGPPTNISCYSNSVVATDDVDMDDVTMGFSTFSAGPSVRSSIRGSVRIPRCSGGTQAMSTSEYTYETLTDQRTTRYSVRTPRVVRTTPTRTETNGVVANTMAPPVSRPQGPLPQGPLPQGPLPQASFAAQCASVARGNSTLAVLEARGTIRPREDEASIITPPKRICAEAGTEEDDDL
jgi:hypothetical protein